MLIHVGIRLYHLMPLSPDNALIIDRRVVIFDHPLSFRISTSYI